jgi:alpha-galactosidase
MADSDCKKIVLVGAGSAVFTRGLLADLIIEGGRWELALVDIDPQALETAFLLGGRMIESRTAPISLSSHLDLREALSGADFVVTTIAVGGRRAWEQDVLIPRKYGIYQPVGDTIMPGGISRALRLIPAMVTIARAVAELAPAARLFNYANPMAAICRGVQKATGVEIVGLCHGVKSGERGTAKLVGVEPERCRFAAVGMNHLCFFTEFEVDGHDAWAQLREAILNAEPDAREALRRELFLEFGAYSVLNDRHLAEFFPQFHRDGSHPGGRLGVDVFSFEGTIEGGDKSYAAMTDQAHGRAPLDESVLERQLGEHEQLVSIFRALEGGESQRFSAILPNTGQVANLPSGFSLESPTEVSTAGIRPVPCGDLPPFTRTVVGKALLTIELAVDAALEQSKSGFLAAIIADGSAATLDDAKALADELWQANQQYLPEG